jgi:hypothetical protein
MSRTILHEGRLYFVYSFHKDMHSALDALDDYYCEGIVCESERPDVVKLVGERRTLWAVIFPDN